MRSNASEIRKDIKTRIGMESMSLVRDYLSLFLKDSIEMMVATNDSETLLKVQGQVRGIKECIRLLENIYSERLTA